VDVGRKHSGDLLAVIFGDFNDHGRPRCAFGSCSNRPWMTSYAFHGQREIRPL
jgi:hypothetical protein